MESAARGHGGHSTTTIRVFFDQGDKLRRTVIGILPDKPQILRKHSNFDTARNHIEELESFPGHKLHVRRASSSGSSSSSYHSSQASPPESSPRPYYPPPDPALPAPDVAPDIVPPSALTSSHKSLLSLKAEQAAQSSTRLTSGVPSLTGGTGGPSASTSFASLHRAAPALGFVDRPFAPHIIPPPRDFHTPDLLGASPYIALQPTPLAQSISTFSQAPLNIPATLQAIQTSLAALHERMATLERSHAALLRRQRRRWWSQDDDELEELEEDNYRLSPKRWTNKGGTKRRRSVILRVWWALVAAMRRATVDLSLAMVLLLIGAVALGGGWRRARRTILRLYDRGRRLLLET